MGRIPDRWLQYSSFGRVIPGTRILPLKVPLKSSITSDIQDHRRFSPTDLAQHYPNLGLVIDLTNTNRYYDKAEFTSRGIEYEKIMCPGQLVPANNLVFRFFDILDAFFDKHRDKIVGVHCTHGVNRTGYFICRYLIQRMSIPPTKALEYFANGRGHPIERQNYVNDILDGNYRSMPKSMPKFPSKSASAVRGKEQEQSKSPKRFSKESERSRDTGPPHRSSTSENWYGNPLPKSKDSAFSGGKQSYGRPRSTERARENFNIGPSKSDGSYRSYDFYEKRDRSPPRGRNRGPPEPDFDAREQRRGEEEWWGRTPPSSSRGSTFQGQGYGRNEIVQESRPMISPWASGHEGNSTVQDFERRYQHYMDLHGSPPGSSTAYDGNRREGRSGFREPGGEPANLKVLEQVDGIKIKQVIDACFTREEKSRFKSIIEELTNRIEEKKRAVTSGRFDNDSSLPSNKAPVWSWEEERPRTNTYLPQANRSSSPGYGTSKFDRVDLKRSQMNLDSFQDRHHSAMPTQKNFGRSLGDHDRQYSPDRPRSRSPLRRRDSRRRSPDQRYSPTIDDMPAERMPSSGRYMVGSAFQRSPSPPMHHQMRAAVHQPVPERYDIDDRDLRGRDLFTANNPRPGFEERWNEPPRDMDMRTLSSRGEFRNFDQREPAHELYPEEEDEEEANWDEMSADMREILNMKRIQKQEEDLRHMLSASGRRQSPPGAGPVASRLGPYPDDPSESPTNRRRRPRRRRFH